MPEEERSAAVFLDRDGTINEEVGYLDRLEKLQLIPGAARAIRLINDSGLKAVVVTNQSGVARGVFDEDFVGTVHARLREMLRAEGAFLDGLYYCPHHPQEGRGKYLRTCTCRKPASGLLLRATEELFLAPECSYMVGDTPNDIQAGAGAGARGVLVRTGYGAEAASALVSGEEQRGQIHGETGRLPWGTVMARPAHIAGDILAAVKWILQDRKP
jgi:D-glycero-D-manno-heptose 1,7-bisphosphate phosphatase